LLRGFEPNLADVSLADLDDWLTDPLFWFGIGGPAILLAIATIYFWRMAKGLSKMFGRTGYRRP